MERCIGADSTARHLGRYEQWVQLAQEASNGNEPGFVVGCRGSRVIAWQFRDALRDLDTLTKAAKRDRSVQSEFDGGYERFVAAIAGSRYSAGAQAAETALAPQRQRGVPLTSRRILATAAFLETTAANFPGADTAMQTVTSDSLPGTSGAGVPSGLPVTAPSTPPRPVSDSLPRPNPKMSYRSYWHTFECWCNARQLQSWPASPETVAAHLRDRAASGALGTVIQTGLSIAATHREAGATDPCASDLVKETIKTIKASEADRRPTVSSCVESPDVPALAKIRATALNPRHSGRGWEMRAVARRRGLVDIAFCSVVLQAGLTCQEAAELTWQDLKMREDGTAVYTIKKKHRNAGTDVLVSKRTIGDLRAVADSTESGGKIFKLTKKRLCERLRSAVQVAGCEDAVAHRLRSGADSAIANVRAGNGIDRFHFRERWGPFRRWCEESGASCLPASAETVASYLRHHAGSFTFCSLENVKCAIARTHLEAGHENPCATALVREVFAELRRANTNPTPQTIDAAMVAEVRASACESRRRGMGIESAETAQRRGLVDIALCSFFQATGFSCGQAAALEWRELETCGEDRMRLVLQRGQNDSSQGAKFVTITGQAVRDLEAIRRDSGQQEKVFGLGEHAIRARLRTAANAAQRKLDSAFDEALA